MRFLIYVGLIIGSVLAFGATPARGQQSIKLFILAGQSNMVGNGSNMEDLPESLRQSQNNVLWYDRNDEWVVLQPPTEPVLNADSSIPVPPFEKYHPNYSHVLENGFGFGPEISLGTAIAENLNETIALVKYSRNGTNLVTHWDPAYSDSLYPRMVKRVNQAIAELSSQGYTVEVAGFFWMQGESDASHEDTAYAYEANLTNFISAVRRDFNNPNLPFVFGLVHATDNYYLANGKVICCGDILRSSELKVYRTVPFTNAVETRNLPLRDDLLHFDSNGLIWLGYYFAFAWLNMHWSTPPQNGIRLEIRVKDLLNLKSPTPNSTYLRLPPRSQP